VVVVGFVLSMECFEMVYILIVLQLLLCVAP
jgi:hypothetical protein